MLLDLRSVVESTEPVDEDTVGGDSSWRRRKKRMEVEQLQQYPLTELEQQILEEDALLEELFLSGAIDIMFDRRG
jgi:hypothetical protein